MTSEPAGTTAVPAAPVPHLVSTFRFDNRMRGEAYGVEIAAACEPVSFWRLTGAFTFFTLELHRDRSSRDTLEGEQAEGGSPRHQASLRSHLTLPWNLELDTGLYYVDSLPRYSIPSYVRLDLRLGWRLRDDASFSLVFQNLLDPSHPEFGAGLFEATGEVERSVYALLAVRF